MINQGANLDGFIAEQYHVQTFNLNAKLSGSKYRAEVLEPAPGETYGKNSVDIVIKDEAGKIVKRYQSKYYQSAEETANAFEQGDYRGQQKLVPSDQIDNIEKKCTDVIEAPDGTKSNPLQKNEAKEKQIDAQNGNEQKLDWNEFDNKELAKSIGKKIGFAGIQGAAIGVGFDIAKKCFNGEKIKPEEEVKVAIETGADFGLKSALGAALKVGSEKGFLKFIPKGTSSSFLGNIAFVAVENVKVLMKAVTKKITPRETVSKMDTRYDWPCQVRRAGSLHLGRYVCRLERPCRQWHFGTRHSRSGFPGHADPEHQVLDRPEDRHSIRHL